MTAFAFRNHAIEPSDSWLPTHKVADDAVVGPHAKLVRAWGIAEEMMALVPPYLADDATDAELQAACSMLNAIAVGTTDAAEGLTSLEAQKAKLKLTRRDSKRKAAIRLGFFEALCTAGCALLSVAAFHGLRKLDWAGGDVFWTDVENAISATGFGAVGFAVAVLLRRLYFARTVPISEIAEFLEQEWKPWELAAVNFVLVIVGVASIFVGIKVIDNFDGFSLIATPWRTLLPGFLLGLAASRVLKGVFGS